MSNQAYVSRDDLVKNQDESWKKSKIQMRIVVEKTENVIKQMEKNE